MSNDRREAVLGCAQVLADHNGTDVVVLDLTKLSLWTDYFIIATATSSTHLGGLVRHLSEHLEKNRLETIRKPRIGEDEEWCLVDAGWFVVHLMSVRAREFFELEKLWFQAEALRITPSPGSQTGGQG